MIFTPGDNEWTDCHRTGGDPLERLAFLREVFYPTDQSLGKRTLTLEQQSTAYPENARWQVGEVTFATLHVVGSNNNLPDAENPVGNAEEYAARNAASLAWLAETFDVAADDQSAAVMLIIQANPGFDLPPEQRTGFNDFLAALEAETIAFGKPVVLVHGDSHYFRIDKPLVASIPSGGSKTLPGSRRSVPTTFTGCGPSSIPATLRSSRSNRRSSRPTSSTIRPERAGLLAWRGCGHATFTCRSRARRRGATTGGVA